MPLDSIIVRGAREHNPPTCHSERRPPSLAARGYLREGIWGGGDGASQALLRADNKRPRVPAVLDSLRLAGGEVRERD